MSLKVKSFFLIIFNLGIAILIFGYSQIQNLTLGFFEKTTIFGISGLAFLGLIFIFASFIQNLLRKENWADHLLSEWFHLKFTIDIFLVLFLALRLFIIQPFFVVGDSMEPSFHNGDFLLVEKLSYKIHPPKRGDVIVFQSPEDPNKIYIKRVIALPKETIEIANGNVVIYNAHHPEGVKIKEPYIEENVQTLGWQKVNLKEGEVFVLGDNRQPNKSSDSREWGPLSLSKIIGRVFCRVFPLQNFQILKHPSYNLLFLLKGLLREKSSFNFI